jgi:hypothetical protein
MDVALRIPAENNNKQKFQELRQVAVFGARYSVTQPLIMGNVALIKYVPTVKNLK